MILIASSVETIAFTAMDEEKAAVPTGMIQPCALSGTLSSGGSISAPSIANEVPEAPLSQLNGIV